MASSKPLSDSLAVAGRLPLQPGDRLDQPTFHERYQVLPEGVRAELIGGVVFMPSPLKRPHGKYHMLLNWWLSEYWLATPGTEALDNATVILGDDSEPQPDATLIILGGQTRENEAGYLTGPPELISEITDSSRSHDLGPKRDDYEHWGVAEYLVFPLQERQALWLARDEGEFAEVPPDEDGILRSHVFPGLWLDPHAFFRVDRQRLQQVLEAGLTSPEHEEFVRRLSKSSTQA